MKDHSFKLINLTINIMMVPYNRIIIKQPLKNSYECAIAIHSVGSICTRSRSPMYSRSSVWMRKKTRVTNYLSRREKSGSPTFNLLDANIKTRTNNPTFVQPTIQFNNNLSSSVIINILKFSNISYKLSTIKKSNQKP